VDLNSGALLHAHKHMLTNALVTLPSCVTEPVAITKAAVPSSGYIGNGSSITVSCSVVVTHTELFKVCGKTSKSSLAHLLLTTFLDFLIHCAILSI